MPQTWTPAAAALSDELGLRFFAADIDENEIRSSLAQAPKWMTYTFIDSNGFYQTPFEFVITPVDGKVTLSMESVNEPIVISEIYLLPPEDVISYADYAKQYADAPEGTGKVRALPTVPERSRSRASISLPRLLRPFSPFPTRPARSPLLRLPVRLC